MQQAEGLFLFKYKQSGEEEERQNYKNKPRQVKNNEGKKKHIIILCISSQRSFFPVQQSPNITFLREKPDKIFLFQNVIMEKSIKGRCAGGRG